VMRTLCTGSCVKLSCISTRSTAKQNVVMRVGL
jgi:hypothetical protein